MSLPWLVFPLAEHATEGYAQSCIGARLLAAKAAMCISSWLRWRGSMHKCSAAVSRACVGFFGSIEQSSLDASPHAWIQACSPLRKLLVRHGPRVIFFYSCLLSTITANSIQTLLLRKHRASTLQRGVPQGPDQSSFVLGAASAGGGGSPRPGPLGPWQSRRKAEARAAARGPALKPERTYKCSRFPLFRAGRAHSSELNSSLLFTVLHNRLLHHALVTQCKLEPK